MIADLLNEAGSLDNVFQLRTLAATTMICDLRSDHRRKVENLIGKQKDHEKVGDRKIWRARIGLGEQWWFGLTAKMAVEKAIEHAEKVGKT